MSATARPPTILTGIATRPVSRGRAHPIHGSGLHAAIEQWDGAHPEDFHAARRAEDDQKLREGFGGKWRGLYVRPLASAAPAQGHRPSSTRRWIETHLDYLGLRDDFWKHDLQRLRACRAARLRPTSTSTPLGAGRPTEWTLILEDLLVGVRGVSLRAMLESSVCAAGRHCLTATPRR